MYTFMRLLADLMYIHARWVFFLFCYFTVGASAGAGQTNLFSFFHFLQNVTRQCDSNIYRPAEQQWLEDRSVTLESCSGNQIKKLQSAARDKALILYSGIW